MGKYSVYKLPSDILRETADKAKILRKRKGWSQAELARRTQISLGSVRRFEQTGKIAFESLLKIAVVLGRLDDFTAAFAERKEQAELDRMFNETKA